MDIDDAAGRIGSSSAAASIAFIRDKARHLGWLIETHNHADHLLGASNIQAAHGGEIGSGTNVTVVKGIDLTDSFSSEISIQSHLVRFSPARPSGM